MEGTMKVLSWFKVYFMLAWFCKTPFIFLLDSKYRQVHHSLLASLTVKVRGRYRADYYDCDDFAWRFKAEANNIGENGVGFVVGWGWGRRSFHCWNIALRLVSIQQIEPQTGRIFVKDRRYLPLVVIL